MDQRDELTWVALELTPLGEEKVQDGTLAGILRSELNVPGDFPVFVPATSYAKGGSSFTILLMEGYAFVGSGLEDTAYFKLEKRPHVLQVLSSNSRGTWKARTPMTVPNSRIEELRRQLEEQASVGVAGGDEVRILHGQYQNLDAVVQAIIGDSAVVQIRLRSIELVTQVPKAFLELRPPPSDPTTKKDRGA